MSQTDVQEIEENIKQAKVIAGKGDALARLTKNKDFQQIIMEGYLKDESVRLVHLKSSPGMQKPDSQAHIVKQIDSIGNLMEYFRVIEHQAMLAQNAIEAGQEELNDIETGEGN